jgi:hypothetical protein
MNICPALGQFLFFLSLCSPGLLAMEIPIADPELTNFFFYHTQGQRRAFVNEKIGIKSNQVEKYMQASMPKSNKQPMTYQSVNRQFRENMKALYDEFILLKYRHAVDEYLFSENKLLNKLIKSEAQLRFKHAEEFKILEERVIAQLHKAKNNQQAQFKQLPAPKSQDEFELAKQQESFLDERARELCDQVMLWHTKAIERL